MKTALVQYFFSKQCVSHCKPSGIVQAINIAVFYYKIVMCQNCKQGKVQTNQIQTLVSCFWLLKWNVDKIYNVFLYPVHRYGNCNEIDSDDNS